MEEEKKAFSINNGDNNEYQIEEKNNNICYK